MKNIGTILVLLGLSLGLCGCPFYWNVDTKTVSWKPEIEPLNWETEDTKNTYGIMRLERGMAEEDVYRILGMPDFYACFESRGEIDDTSVFYYYTHTVVDDKAATAAECTPVVFVNGTVAGWGKDFYASLKKPDTLINVK